MERPEEVRKEQTRQTRKEECTTSCLKPKATHEVQTTWIRQWHLHVTVTYCSINPTFELHSIYLNSNEPLDDYLRIAFTRFRTSSHRLKVETGRWSRLPRERRLCKCGMGVQTEEHALVECELVEPIKEKYGISVQCFSSFMSLNKSKAQLQMLHEILKMLEDQAFYLFGFQISISFLVQYLMF